jgi:hypothetical protein
MDTQSILAALREERNRIDAALAALSGISRGNGRRRGAVSVLAAAPPVRRRTRTLSAAARKKISEAAKARWDKAKKAGRNSL